VFGGLYILMILPVAAAGQWMVTDRPNLWILAVSGARPATFFVGWWIGLAAITGATGAAITLSAGIASGRFDAIGLAATVAGALGGCAGSVAAAAKFPYAPNEITVVPFLHFLLTGGMAAAALLPVFLIGWALGPIPVVLWAVLIPAVACVGLLARAFVAAAAKNPVL